MLAQFTAVDGIYKIGTEAFVLSAGEDGVKGGNLLPDRYNVSTYTLYSSPTLETHGNIGLKLTGAGNYDKTATTVPGTYYLLRAYVSPDSNTSSRIYAGTTGNTGDLGITTYSSSEGFQQVVFKASGTSTYVGFQNQTGSNASYWSSIELLEIESFGVDETTDLVTNGTFTSNITGWTDVSGAGGNLAWNPSGYLDLVNTTGTSVGYQAITTIPEQIYRLMVDKVGVPGVVKIEIGTAFSSSNLRLIYDFGAVGTYTFYFKAASTTTYIQFSNGLASSTASIDNVSVTKSGQLITNHDFSDSTNVDWSGGGNTTISVTGDRLRATAIAAGYIQAYRSLVTVAGNEYTVTFEYSTDGVTGNTYIYIGTSAGSNADYTLLITAGSVYTVTFTASSALTYITFSSANALTAEYTEFDNITMRLSAPDLSTNADGFNYHGQLQKVPVNVDADTVAWTGFGADDYIEQPNNSNLNAGLDGITIEGWVRNKGNSATEIICSLGYYTGSAWSGAWVEMYLNTSGYLVGLVSDDGNASSDTITSTVVIDDNEWHHLALVVTGNGSTNQYLDLYKDGSLAASQVTMTAALATLTNSSATFMIGRNQASGSPFTNGQIATMKAKLGSHTAQEIRNIYEYEKRLFYRESTYQVIGDTINYEVDLTSESLNRMDSISYSDSMDLSGQIATINGQKTAHQVTTVPFNESQVKYAQRFLRMTPGQAFTFSLIGKQYAPIDAVTVYKTSQNESISRVGKTLRQYSFTVRKTR